MMKVRVYYRLYQSIKYILKSKLIHPLSTFLMTVSSVIAKIINIVFPNVFLNT